MKKTVRLFAFLLFAGLLTACEKDGPLLNNPDAQTGAVTGKITDAAGNPLANIKVTIEHTVWAGTYLFATTDEKGNYKATLPAEPAGSWTAKAQLKKSAYGKEYTFDLAVDNTAAFTRNGATVRNFTWKLSGQKPDGGSYGAHVDLYQWATDVPMEQVKVIFTPRDASATLIDGSTFTTVERPVEDVAGTFMVKDVPIGNYTIKAVYPGKTLLLDNRHEDDTPAVSQPVVFGKNGYLAETEYNIEFFLSE
jgi:hypothetical protein